MPKVIKVPIGYFRKKKEKRVGVAVYVKHSYKNEIKKIYKELESTPLIKIFNVVKISKIYKIIKLKEEILIFEQVTKRNQILFSELKDSLKDDFLNDFRVFLSNTIEKRKKLKTLFSSPVIMSIPSPILTDEELEELLNSFED